MISVFNASCALYVGVTVYSYYKYGLGTGPVWLKGLNCTGKEHHLFNCPVVNIPPNIDLHCDHYYDAGVLCTGKMEDVCSTQ